MKSKEATQSIQMRQIMHYKLQKKYAYCFAPVSRSVVYQALSACMIHIIRILYWIDNELYTNKPPREVDDPY